MAQHAFGMVAGRFGFNDCGGPGGVQARQQHSRFHLGRCHWQCIAHRQGLIGANHGHGRAALVTGDKFCPEFRQRVGNTAHRTFAQRRIAGKKGGDRMGRHNTGQQANPGAGIAHVNHGIGLAQCANPHTFNMPGAVFIPGDMRAQLAHGIGSCQHIFAFQKAGNAGFPFGQAPKHQRAV